MSDCDLLPDGFDPRGETPPGETGAAEFESALLREQYRSLARLGPYVHGVIILATAALYCTTAPASLIAGILLPAALLAVSTLRLMSWLRARIRRTRDDRRPPARGYGRARPRAGAGVRARHDGAASTAESTWSVRMAQVAVWIAAAACAFCLSALGSVAGVVVAAATAPLVVAFLSRGADLTLWLAALMTIAACFVIRMLGENSPLFAEIVRSRFAMAEKQRAAEDAKEAAMAIALTDDLTGLPNRRCFLGELAERITTRAGTGRPFAVGLIDLDGFKPINDNHGHPAGDDILRQVAGRLADALAGRGSAARMGGDEFAILCDGIGAHDEAIALGEEIQAIFTAPFAVDGRDIALTGACGFALFPLPPPSRTSLCAWQTPRSTALRLSAVAAWPSSRRPRMTPSPRRA